MTICRFLKQEPSFSSMKPKVFMSRMVRDFFDKRAMRSCELLDGRQRHAVALAMAIATAPWLFFIPLY